MGEEGTHAPKIPGETQRSPSHCYDDDDDDDDDDCGGGGGSDGGDDDTKWRKKKRRRFPYLVLSEEGLGANARVALGEAHERLDCLSFKDLRLRVNGVETDQWDLVLGAPNRKSRPD